MKTLLAVRALLTAALLILCCLMAGCGAGSIPALADGSITSTQNPLVAVYTVAAACPGQVMVEFGPTTSYGRTTPWSPINGNEDSTSVLVAGMRASTTYHMRAQVRCSNGATSTSPDKTFTTGPIPTSSSLVFPQLAVSRPNPSLSYTENPGIESIDVTYYNTPAFFTDRDGNVIWYYDTGAGNFAYPFKLMPNGNILLGITNAVSISTLREIDLAGNTIREMTTQALEIKMANATGFDFVPAGFTHDFVPLANGHVIVLVFDYKDFTDLPGHPGTITVQGEGLIDLDQNWNPVWAWNTFDHLDVSRDPDGLPSWTHSNALLYSPNDGNLILSMRNQSWIIKIDYNNGAGTGNILWTLGYQGDFALTNDGVAVPSDDATPWFAEQHYPIILNQKGPVTTLAIFDNGDQRPLDLEGDVCSFGNNPWPVCYSRPVIFQVDESTMVANIVWADPLQVFSIWGGSINQFPNGNVEYDANSFLVPPSPNLASQVQEVTPDSPPQVVWQMNVAPFTDNAYRAYRVPSLYNGVTWPY
ncbi:MAG: aryl-sulfate sulfotransferase [Candidatus Sulfotelmatobacter sp.]